MVTTIVITAGGRGTRMGSLADDKPKHLIEVNGRPFMHHLIDRVVEAGFTKIYLVIGYKKEVWSKHWTDIQADITFIDQFDRVREKYGTACPIEAVQPELHGQSFVAVYGDNLYSVTDLRSVASDDEYCYVAGLEHDHPERYGVLKTDGEFLTKIVEKPQTFVGNLINTGLYKFTPDVFTVLPKIRLSPREEYELTDVVTLLAEQKKVKVKRIQDYWLDFGKPEDIDKVAKFLDTAVAN
ncbi:MAG: sugar phosphate nucleotidyltransferase [bacterium]|nr:sugar phosphate nucleotidyltransferase [bacterium]